MFDNRSERGELKFAPSAVECTRGRCPIKELVWRPCRVLRLNYIPSTFRAGFLPSFGRGLCPRREALLTKLVLANRNTHLKGEMILFYDVVVLSLWHIIYSDTIYG